MGKLLPATLWGYIAWCGKVTLVPLVILVIFVLAVVIIAAHVPQSERDRREVECRIAARAAGHLDYIIRDKRETGCDVLIGGGEVVALGFGGAE